MNCEKCRKAIKSGAKKGQNSHIVRIMVAARNEGDWEIFHCLKCGKSWTELVKKSRDPKRRSKRDLN